MFKLLIADDEQIVIEGIKNSINWSEYDIKVVGTAKNGTEALKLAEELQPDIIISDIKMPGLDGLALIEKLKAFLPNVKVVLISAYEEFDYAKQAIRLGVNSYLSKPVKKSEVINEVCKIKQLLERKKHEEEAAIRLQQRFNENLPVLREHFLNTLIRGNTVSDLEIKFQTYHINLSPHKTGVMVCKIDHLRSINFTDEAQVQLLMLRITDIINELILPVCKGVTFQSYNQEIITIFNVPDEIEFSIEELIKLAEKIKERILDETEIEVSIGIGRIYSEIKDIGLAYKEAVKALNYRLVYGDNNVLYIENVEDIETVNYSALININELLENIQNILYTGKQEEVYALVDNFRQRLQNAEKIPYYYIQQLYIQLLSIILRTATEIGIGTHLIAENNNLYGTLLEIDSFSELDDWIKGILGNVCEQISAKNQLKTKHSIQKAINYIREHCQEEISLTSVANYVRLNPTYFSRFFKEETGCSFVDYLKKLRIEKAKELLRTSNLKIYEICEALGYQSVQYFSTLFKNMVGLTPQEYREKA